MAAKRNGEVTPKRPNAARETAEDGIPENDRRTELETVERLLGDLERKIRETGFKPAVADLIRLLLLRRDLEEEQPKEITVQWVEPEMDGEEPIAG